MNMLSKTEFNQIKNWIYRNARPLEFARWKYHFENGNPHDVITVLSIYQNEDGCFGNAVEADSWNPHSSPYSTGYVIGLLEEINFNTKTHPLIQNMLRYLENTPDFNGKYWPALIKSNDNYPHAPWCVCYQI